MSEWNVTFVTYCDLPNLDADDLLALRLLEQHGFRCQAAVWNDSSVDWENAGLCVLRSTWDYHLHAEQFLNWVNSLSGRVANSADLVHWNCNKRYIVALGESGVSVVPSRFVEQGESFHLQPFARECGWNDVIIKPAIGLATAGVKRFRIPEEIAEAQMHLDFLSVKGGVLLQKFMPAVCDFGERDLVFINGEFSHAVRKRAFQQLAIAGAAGETPAQATKAEIELAVKTLSVLPEVPLYARVDMVPDDNGNNVIMELELIEPSLFMAFHPPCAEHFANAIESRVRCLQTVGS
jgi:glutathione synthase/RimK-type ligase-like ATP-grasp enzyme